MPIAGGLGHVMAHEIGHLLMGVNGHSDQGLMRQEWNPRERQVQTFTSSQAQIIRSRFTATASELTSPGFGGLARERQRSSR